MEIDPPQKKSDRQRERQLIQKKKTIVSRESGEDYAAGGF